MRHPRLAFVLIAASLLGTAALSLLYEDWSFLKERRPLRIGVDVWVGFAPLYLAQDQGFFRARGVEVQLKVMKGAEEIRAALAAGELDGQTTSLDTVLMQVDQGIPSLAVLALDRSDGGDGLIASSGIRSVAGLRGKTVAFQPATPSHFFLMYLLDRAAMTLKDVQVRTMDAGDAGAAFLAGRVDAAVTWEPWLSRAMERSDATLLATTRGDQTVIVDVLAFHPSVLRDRPDDVRSVVAAWEDAVAWWKANPSEANRLMAAHYGLETSEFETMIGGLRYLGLPENQQLFGTLEKPGDLVELARLINRIFIANGITRVPHALNEILAFDFL